MWSTQKRTIGNCLKARTDCGGGRCICKQQMTQGLCLGRSPWFHHPELRDVPQPTVLHCQAFFNRHAQHLFSLHRVCRHQEPAPQPELGSCAFYCCLSNLQPVQPSTAWGLIRGTQLRPAAVPFHLPESQQPVICQDKQSILYLTGLLLR